MAQDPTKNKPNLVMLYISIDKTHQRFKAYINRNVHKTIELYLNYLSTTLNQPNPSTLILGKETLPGSGVFTEVKNVFDIIQGIELTLG